MVAVAADGTHLPNLQIARENKPIENGAVVASENQGEVRIGLCTAVEGCYMSMLALIEVNSGTLRAQQAASADWKDANKLLTNCNMRALRSTGRLSYAISDGPRNGY
jgi:hypothetical protein